MGKVNIRGSACLRETPALCKSVSSHGASGMIHTSNVYKAMWPCIPEFSLCGMAGMQLGRQPECQPLRLHLPYSLSVLLPPQHEEAGGSARCS